MNLPSKSCSSDDEGDDGSEGWVSVGDSSLPPAVLPVREPGEVVLVHAIPSSQLAKIDIGSVVEVEIEGGPEDPTPTVWVPAKVSYLA
jgi:hypothetical protein